MAKSKQKRLTPNWLFGHLQEYYFLWRAAQQGSVLVEFLLAAQLAAELFLVLKLLLALALEL